MTWVTFRIYEARAYQKPRRPSTMFRVIVALLLAAGNAAQNACYQCFKDRVSVSGTCSFLDAPCCDATAPPTASPTVVDDGASASNSLPRGELLTASALNRVRDAWFLRGFAAALALTTGVAAFFGLVDVPYASVSSVDPKTEGAAASVPSHSSVAEQTLPWGSQSSVETA